MRAYLLTIAFGLAVAAAACADQPSPMVPAAGGSQRACKADSDCPKNDQCERGRCLTPNDIGPQPPL